MPGCARIAGSLHMTIQMEVLIDTLKDLNSDLRWWSLNIFSTQYHTLDFIMHDEPSNVFSWKGESLEETVTESWMHWHGGMRMVRVTDLTLLSMMGLHDSSRLWG